MRKRLTSFLLVIVLIISLLSLTSCGSKKKYEYSNITAIMSYVSVRETMNFTYEDTRLNINDDGTWEIDMSIFLFLRSNIDKGTYTVEDGLYTFEGFKYGMKATGKETDNGGFEIYFADLLDDSKNVITLYFFED